MVFYPQNIKYCIYIYKYPLRIKLHLNYKGGINLKKKINMTMQVAYTAFTRVFAIFEFVEATLKNKLNIYDSDYSIFILLL